VCTAPFRSFFTIQSLRSEIAALQVLDSRYTGKRLSMPFASGSASLHACNLVRFVHLHCYIDCACNVFDSLCFSGTDCPRDRFLSGIG
jgi:hypothetical protein